MRQARDTFLKFLSDNLPSSIQLHNLRRDTNFPSSNQLQMNALNIQFLSDSPRVLQSGLTVTVDAIADQELDAIDMATTAFTLLSQSGMTPLLDYTDHTHAPVPLSSNLFWDTEAIKFRPVYGDTYFRHSALIALSYHLY